MNYFAKNETARLCPILFYELFLFALFYHLFSTTWKDICRSNSSVTSWIDLKKTLYNYDLY